MEAEGGVEEIVAINEDEEEESEEDMVEVVEEEMEVEQKQGRIKEGIKKLEAKEEEDPEIVDINSIGAHWIETQLHKYYEAN